MAKRTRGSSSAYRPGGQGPSRNNKSSGTPDAASDTAQASSATADLDAAVDSVVPSSEVTELTVDDTSSATKQSKRRRNRRSPKVKADSLEARAVAEDVYVREDLRRIGMISIVLVAMLALAWIVFVALDVLDLY